MPVFEVGRRGPRHHAERTVRVDEEEEIIRKVNEETEIIRRMNDDVELQQEWLRQDSLVYGALILIGLYMVQPFLTAGSLDLSAKICVVAFSVAIPLLASLVLLNRQEIFRHHRSTSFYVTSTRVIGQGCASVGIVTGFWHITWIAGAGILAGAFAGMFVHAAGFWHVEQLKATPSLGSGERKDTGN